MFLLFAAMPTIVTRAGSVSRPNDTAEAEVCGKLTIEIPVIRTGLE
jgi:hypothetical protein